MKRCYTLSKSGNRININTFKRTLYPRLYQSVVLPVPVSSVTDTSFHPNVSKPSRLPWYVRFILWIKRNFFHINC